MLTRRIWWLIVLIVSATATIATAVFGVMAWRDYRTYPGGWHGGAFESLSPAARERFVVLGFPKNADGAAARSQANATPEIRVQRAVRFSLQECRAQESQLIDHGRSLTTPRDEWTTEPPADWFSKVSALQAEYLSRNPSAPYRASLEWRQVAPDGTEFTLTIRDGDFESRCKYRAGADLPSVVPIEYAHRNLRTASLEQVTGIAIPCLITFFALAGLAVSKSAFRAFTTAV